MSKLISKGVIIDVQYVPTVENIHSIMVDLDSRYENAPPTFAFIHRNDANSYSYTLYIANDITDSGKNSNWEGTVGFINSKGELLKSVVSTNYCILHELGHVVEDIGYNPFSNYRNNLMQESDSYRNGNKRERSEVFAHYFATFYAIGSEYTYVGFLMNRKGRK